MGIVFNKYSLSFLRLNNYAVKLNIGDLDEGLIGEISMMERYLMKSHDLIQTRGKVIVLLFRINLLKS